MKTIIEVPLSDISTMDESGETVSPEKGDVVTVTTQGRIVGTNGPMAQVEVGADSGEGNEDAAPEGADMEAELQKMYDEQE